MCVRACVCSVREKRGEAWREGIDLVRERERESTIDGWINWTLVLFFSVQGLLPIHSGGNRGVHRYWWVTVLLFRRGKNATALFIPHSKHAAAWNSVTTCGQYRPPCFVFRFPRWLTYAIYNPHPFRIRVAWKRMRNRSRFFLICL